MNPKNWHLYILHSESINKFYTGITIDVKRRLYEHNHQRRGAKFTKQGRPWVLVYQEIVGTVQNALKRELILKKYSKAQKQALIDTYTANPDPLPVWEPESSCSHDVSLQCTCVCHPKGIIIHDRNCCEKCFECGFNTQIKS